MFQSPDSGSLMPQATRRVLVVDDEPTLRLGFSYALASSSTQVETAGTGRQALEAMAKADFDIIVLDLRMPDIDGLGVIRSIRNVGILTPIVLCSAALNPTSAMQALLHGVVDFLLKPIRPADLRGVVDFVLTPPNKPFPLAMRAARHRDFMKAIEFLSQEAAPAPRTTAWGDVLTLLLHQNESGDGFLLENKVRQHLNLLAFRLPDAP